MTKKNYRNRYQIQNRRTTRASTKEKTNVGVLGKDNKKPGKIKKHYKKITSKVNGTEKFDFILDEDGDYILDDKGNMVLDDMESDNNYDNETGYQEDPSFTTEIANEKNADTAKENAKNAKGG